ncbi:AraC family transcriptional regulator ligand-binding domain-containing protein [Gordonia sp. (in: high G+C Gram-positive bacteria)]|uniref:AraC family transcriptional regulator n=1 Tax=Gordonia sp. (in: high G+C Gram-positive bacteria) TaxID=84139 RepID=UPI003F9CD467
MAYTIPMQFFHATIEALSRRDIDIVDAVHESGLDWQAFAADRSRMTPEQATAFVRSLWDQTDDELLGVGPRHLPRGSMRLAALTVIHARDLRSALNRILEFTAVTTGVHGALMVDDGLATLRLETTPEDSVDPIIAFSAAAGVHRFSSWLIDAPVTVQSLRFPFDASHLAADYETIFGSPAEFSANEMSISFDAALLSRPVIRNESDLKPYLRDAPGSLFYQRGNAATVASRVRRILENDPWIDSEALAGLIFMSAPNLRRRLRGEGTSVRAIQDSILSDRAVEALVHSDESIAEISARLGYSEPSAFRRAFRRWIGSAPTSYRRRTP